jgi:hypothetical protein
MLRMIIGHSRRRKVDVSSGECEIESWVDWVKRTTREAEQRMDGLGIESWIGQSRRLKWRFAGKMARGSQDKWSYKILNWMPELDAKSSRSQGRPRTRWEDAIAAITSAHCGTWEWTVAARDHKHWNQLEAEYIKH